MDERPCEERSEISIAEGCLSSSGMWIMEEGVEEAKGVKGGKGNRNLAKRRKARYYFSTCAGGFFAPSQKICAGSSVVEQGPFKPKVVGPIPTQRTTDICHIKISSDKLRI